jgi:type II protein arginine methyltransferase
VSLVVTETMDAGLLGEHVLQTLVDAWDRLLLSPCSNLFSPKESRRHGIVIPYGSCVYVAGVQCPFIARGAYVSSDRWDALQLGHPGMRLSALAEEAYDSEDLAHVPGGFVMVTAPARALEINFNDPEELRHHLVNPTTKKVGAELGD